MKASNTAELYELLLARIEVDYGGESKSVSDNAAGGENAVAAYTSVIWASRKGLRVDQELQPLLSELGFEPRAWQPVALALEELTLRVGG